MKPSKSLNIKNMPEGGKEHLHKLITDSQYRNSPKHYKEFHTDPETNKPKNANKVKIKERNMLEGLPPGGPNSGKYRLLERIGNFNASPQVSYWSATHNSETTFSRPQQINVPACKKCNGTGDAACPQCQSSGQVVTHFFDNFKKISSCQQCEGRGYSDCSCKKDAQVVDGHTVEPDINKW
ncbi:MAG: hypothetical protein K0R66_1656 [Gammaproteobacteria bacterium]|jgi:hypothetical protein|nr:hypothetical protein [Gammaproteobacteria bacterium]